MIVVEKFTDRIDEGSTFDVLVVHKPTQPESPEEIALAHAFAMLSNVIRVEVLSVRVRDQRVILIPASGKYLYLGTRSRLTYEWRYSYCRLVDASIVPSFAAWRNRGLAAVRFILAIGDEQ